MKSIITHNDLSKTRKSGIAPWAASLTIWLLFGAVFTALIETAHKREHAVAEDQAMSMVHAMSSALRTMGARWASSKEDLSSVLADITATPSILGIAMIASTNTLIAGEGLTQNFMTEQNSPNGTMYTDNSIIVWDTVNIGSGSDGMQMRRGWQNRHGGTGAASDTEGFNRARLYANIDIKALNARHLRDIAIMISYWILTLILAMGCALIWSARRRMAIYALQLQLAKEENKALEEMTLVAAGLAHEIKNPLGIIRGTAQRLQDNNGTPLIIQEIDRITSRINEFLSFAKGRTPELNPVSVNDICSDLKTLLQDELHESGLSLVCEADCTIQADKELFRQVLFNLIHNSIRFAPGSGEITISFEHDENGYLSLHFRDHGPGVPAEIEERIFSPYVSSSSKGSGLGLAIVQRICRAHGWTISCMKLTGAGAQFSITGIKEAEA